MRSLLLLVLLTACTQRGEPQVAPAPPPPPPSSALPAPPPSNAVAPACATVETTALKLRADFGALQNVRVAADANGALVTWERLSTPKMGDTAQVGFAAFTDPRGAVTTAIALPARAYAAAVYTSVAPTSPKGDLDLFTYGVAGAPAFATYAVGPRPWKGLDVFLSTGPAPHRTATIPFALSEPLAAAATIPLAIAAGGEAPCESYYACEEKYLPAAQRGLVKSVRAISLGGAKARSELLFVGTSTSPVRPFAPAVAAGPSAALAAYRVDTRLEAVWLRHDGAKQRAFPLGAPGDVGAPALAWSGERAYAAWATRASKTDPYRVWVAIVEATGVAAAGFVDTGSESAFAPAIAVHGADVILAWMEGNDGTRGRVRMGLLPLDRIAPPSGAMHLRAALDVTDDGNHRDPELAVAGDRVHLAWSDFTKAGEGIPMLRTMSCP